jgi:hypothetical protein
LLAKTGRADFADLRRLNPDSEQIQELKTLTRDQDSLIQMQTRLVNQLTACRKRVLPGRAGAVLQAAPTFDAAVFAGLCDPAAGDVGFGRADPDHPQVSQASPSCQDRPTDC